MTREEILSIEGVEHLDYSFKFKNIEFQEDYNFDDDDCIDAFVDCILFEGKEISIKPISDIETLKQFLNFFDC